MNLSIERNMVSILSGSFGKETENAAIKSSPYNLFHVACKWLKASFSEFVGDLVLQCLLRWGEAECGRFTPDREKQLSVPSRFWKVEQFHRTAPDCYFKGSDRGLLRRNCTWTCCAEMQQKAYNLRATLTVLKAFSGMRNTKLFALLVVKCKFGGIFFCPKRYLATLGRLKGIPALICSFNILCFLYRSHLSVHQNRQPVLLLNCGLCPPWEFRYDEGEFGMHRDIYTKPGSAMHY